MRRFPLEPPVRLAFLLLAALVFAASAGAQPSLARLRTEYKENPLGIDARRPRFSWELVSSARGVVQAAYQVRVAASEAGLAKRALWDTGRVQSGESTQIQYAGPGYRLEND